MPRPVRRGPRTVTVRVPHLHVTSTGKVITTYRYKTVTIR